MNSNEPSLTEEQIRELSKRHKAFEKGKLTTLSWKEVKKNVRKKLRETKREKQNSVYQTI